MSESAVNFLFNKLWDSNKDKMNWYFFLDYASKMYKSDIIEAYKAGEKSAINKMVMDEWSESDVHNEDAEQYYNKKYTHNGIKTMNE